MSSLLLVSRALPPIHRHRRPGLSSPSRWPGRAARAAEQQVLPALLSLRLQASRPPAGASWWKLPRGDATTSLERRSRGKARTTKHDVEARVFRRRDLKPRTPRRFNFRRTAEFPIGQIGTRRSRSSGTRYRICGEKRDESRSWLRYEELRRGPEDRWSRSIFDRSTINEKERRDTIQTGLESYEFPRTDVYVIYFDVFERRGDRTYPRAGEGA